MRHALLPADPDDEQLARGWTLSEADLVEVYRCRGEHMRFSFALQLCTLRQYGRFLGADYFATARRADAGARRTRYTGQVRVAEATRAPYL